MKKENCIHWTGIQKECCKAGVNYAELTGGRVSGWGMMLPCWTSTLDTQKNYEKVLCEKFQAPTEAQLKQGEDEIKSMISRVGIVMRAIASWRKELPIGKYKSMDCPTGCGGTLHLSQAACNGHVHGSCSTEGCVRWME